MPTTPPPPVGRYRDAAGDERLAVRAMWLQGAPDLVCPAGHRLPVTTHALEEFTWRCRYHPDRHRRTESCGRCVYVITDWKGADGTAFNLVVEVTDDEIRHMRRLPMSQKLVYLGLTPKVMRADQAS